MASGKRSTNGKGKKGSIRPGTFILSLFIHLLHHAFNGSLFSFIVCIPLFSVYHFSKKIKEYC